MKGKLDINKDKFHRFNFQRGSNLDVAHLEHIISQTKSKAVVLMPVGFTFRASNEGKFRQYLIENNLIEAIIQLPPNLHSATSIETTFLVINKNKVNDKVLFINLKDESFITRLKRSLVFKNIDEIVNIYTQNKEIENISAVITNGEIADNNYNFTIDRYVISPETKKLQQVIKNFELVKLEDVAEIRRSQLFKDEEIGGEIYELSPSDFNSSGFTINSKKTKHIQEQQRKLQTYQLQSYDVLLSTKGTIGKIAIVGDTDNILIASQAIQVIRLSGEGKKEKAISLYMFLKSELGQTMLQSKVAGAAMPQIATSEIRNLQIPILNEEQTKQLVSNFEEEIKLYFQIDKIENKINSIHNNFLGENK
jgi:type I restriction enzyme M protein